MTDPQTTLDDVLYWLSLEESKPTAALISEYRTRFPQFAEAITAFALDLSVDSLRAPIPEAVENDDAPSDTVMRAISNFQNLLYQKKNSAHNGLLLKHGPEVTSGVNPFKSLSVPKFKELAREVGANTVFATKLRNRQIVFETIPTTLMLRVAEKLDVPLDYVSSYLSAQPSYETTQLFHKAIDKPIRQPQETYEQAVRTSQLSPEQQKDLLSL
jgi:hypothetical protein